MQRFLTSLLTGAAWLVAATTAVGSKPEAVYIVPAWGDLAVDAVVVMDRARLTAEGGVLRLDYRLPRELDGEEPQRFRLTGPALAGEVELVSHDGGVTATCDDGLAATQCFMRYVDGIELDDEAAERVLAATVTDLNRLAELRAARGVLEHQAVGIIRFVRD